jgi:hypothetical protein
MYKVLGAAQTVTIVLGIEYGRGRHAVTLQEEQFNQMLMVRLKKLATRRH